MLKNIGPVDRVIGLAIGFRLSAYAIPLGVVPTGWNWIGVVPVLTAAIGFCPLYTLVGISTSRAKHAT